MKYSIEKQLDCVRRELFIRKNTYPSMVARGQKSQTSADLEIDIMTDVMNTLILARNAHLDKSWNKPEAITEWQSYPEHKPGENQKYQDFLVAYTNPRHINKSGFEDRTPAYQYTVLSWMGDDFLNIDHLPIKAFAPFAVWEK